jgi:NitT/TauT family transport system ATP-binding protein
MAHLEFYDLSVVYRSRRGQHVKSLARVSLAIPDRQFVSIVGPSGCGKSTLLRVAAGLMQPTDGKVLFDRTVVESPNADRGMVFQSYTLFPWLTVQQNISFGLRERGVVAAAREETAHRFLELVGLTEFGSAYPKELSGGMMQRAALARALANQPKLLLMDEPFGALDAQTRLSMQELLLNIWQADPMTILFVTHDIEEAILLSDTVYVMTARPGRIESEFVIPFSRPRGLEIRDDPAFVELRRAILTLLSNRTSGLALNGPARHAVRGDE